MGATAAELQPAAVIGPGRVGRAVATALHRLDLDVTLGVRESSGMAGSPDPVTGLDCETPVNAARGARLVMLCVQDDQLPTLVTDLAAHHAFECGQTVVHTAGVDGPVLLTPAAAAGALVAACHPVQTFTDDLEATMARLPGSIWGVTGDSAGRAAGRALVGLLGGIAMDVPESGRARYHAALVLAANGAAALSAVSADLLRTGGVIDPARVLAKLVHASVDSALATGQAGLSGPWVRGDGRTIAMHLEGLAHRPKVVEAYTGLARLVADRAATAGRLTPEARRRIDAALERATEPGD